MGLADTQYQVGVAYTTSFCHTDDVFTREPERFMPVYGALMDCVRKEEGITERRTFHFYSSLKESGHPITES